MWSFSSKAYWPLSDGWHRGYASAPGEHTHHRTPIALNKKWQSTSFRLPTSAASFGKAYGSHLACSDSSRHDRLTESSWSSGVIGFCPTVGKIGKLKVHCDQAPTLPLLLKLMWSQSVLSAAWNRWSPVQHLNSWGCLFKSPCWTLGSNKKEETPTHRYPACQAQKWLHPPSSHLGRSIAFRKLILMPALGKWRKVQKFKTSLCYIASLGSLGLSQEITVRPYYICFPCDPSTVLTALSGAADKSSCSEALFISTDGLEHQGREGPDPNYLLWASFPPLNRHSWPTRVRIYTRWLVDKTRWELLTSADH